MSEDQTGAGDFLIREFGEHASAVSAALVAAGEAAHQRSLNAKAGSELDQNYAYGATFWQALPQEVVRRLTEVLDGAAPHPRGTSPYQVLLWKETLFLPVKAIEGGTRNGRHRVRTSTLRALLTQVNIPEPPPETLFDVLLDVNGADETEQHMLQAVERARETLGNTATKTVVVTYDCTADGGLQSVRAGLATIDERGFVHYTDSEPLVIGRREVNVGKPKEVVATFDSGRRPMPPLRLVKEETGTDDDGSGSEGDSTRSK